MAVGRQADESDRRFRHRLAHCPPPVRPLACRAAVRQQRRPMPFDFDHPAGTTRRPGAREMTALLAGLMALNAFAIDAMIPALPDIGRSLHVARENDRQLVVIAYFIGFASSQLFWGPLADRFGRKPIL